MAKKKKNIEKDKPEKEKPQFEIKGFVLSISIEELDKSLRGMSKPEPKKRVSYQSWSYMSPNFDSMKIT